MATFKHAWMGAFLLAMMVASVLAEHSSAAAGDGAGKKPPRPGKRTPPPKPGKPQPVPSPPTGGREANVTAFLNAINGGEALEAQPTPVCIQFYQQFFEGTQLQTVAPVGPNFFGRIDVFEVNVTRTPDPNSRRIAIARGVLLWDNQEFPGYENKWTLTFTEESGLPVNSSINFEGFEPATEFFPQPYNYSVVGGTGAFACAKGVVTESVAFSNATLETDQDIACMVVGCGFNRTNAFYLFSSQPGADIYA